MYQNRWEAGELLAQRLAEYQFKSVCVLGIPRGGVVVAAPIARFFKTKLGVLVTRKVGHPLNDELAIGAVMPDGSAVLDTLTIQTHHIGKDYLERTIATQYAELRRRMKLYTGSEMPPDVKGKTVIVVDDGIATGYTMKAAVAWLKTLQPEKIIVAVPVAPPETIAELAKSVDTVVCPQQPADFMAVGMHYREFPQTSDAEAIELLHEF
ncbi:MAG: phosphoribosyltransferase [Firmicutes bacterium]|nr:phosphoribosyltransferase [Bacillota bacterium]